MVMDCRYSLFFILIYSYSSAADDLMITEGMVVFGNLWLSLDN